MKSSPGSLCIDAIVHRGDEYLRRWTPRPEPEWGGLFQAKTCPGAQYCRRGAVRLIRQVLTVHLLTPCRVVDRLGALDPIPGYHLIGKWLLVKRGPFVLCAR